MYHVLTSGPALPWAALPMPQRATPIVPISQKGKLRHGEIK